MMPISDSDLPSYYKVENGKAWCCLLLKQCKMTSYKLLVYHFDGSEYSWSFLKDSRPFLIKTLC